jgi:hypothetical protein
MKRQRITPGRGLVTFIAAVAVVSNRRLAGTIREHGGSESIPNHPK